MTAKLRSTPATIECEEHHERARIEPGPDGNPTIQACCKAMAERLYKATGFGGSVQWGADGS
jgi:hypothetical protein